MNFEIDRTIAFPDYEIEDGTPVKVFNDPKVPYEFIDGRIVRVVNSESIVSDESARFEVSESNYDWIYVLGTILLLIAGVSAWISWGRK